MIGRVPTNVGTQESFLRSCNVSPATLREYSKLLTSFASWLEVERDGIVEEDTLLGYRSHLLDRGFSPTSVGTSLTPPRLFLAYFARLGLIQSVPTVHGPPTPRGMRRVPLAAEQLTQVLAAINTSDLIGLRDYALIAFMAAAGATPLEATGAVVGDLYLEQPSRALLASTGRPVRTVALPANVELFLSQYLQVRALQEGRLSPTAPLFPGFGPRNTGRKLSQRALRKIVQQHFEAAGIKTANHTAYSLRHTAAREALRSFLGLADGRRTDVYAPDMHEHVPDPSPPPPEPWNNDAVGQTE